MMSRVSCRLSAHRHSLPRSSDPRWGTGPPLRSAYPHTTGMRDPIEVPTFHTYETRPGRVPPVSRGGGAHPADKKSPAGACRFTAASPTPRYHIPSSGAHA
jgi:hypothetical protein